MARNYYIFSSGRIRRKENTIFFEKEGKKKPLPVEDIEQIYIFGEVDFNTKFINFCSQNNIIVHFFNYYGFYTGTFYPKGLYISGELIIKQVEHYLDYEKRLYLAKQFILASIYNQKRNLIKRKETDLSKDMKEIENEIKKVDTIEKLMSIEAYAKKYYYKSFEKITGWKFEKRSIRPPLNPLNALISFGNSLVYTLCLQAIFLTPLSPAISYLHQPSQRRYSLSLDVAEIFKPIFSDRLIFRLINLGKLKENDFEKSLNYSYLNENGRRVFVEEFDNMVNSTIYHRKLKRKVKYKTLIRLELYKLIKHLIEGKKYKSLRVWW